MMHEDAGSSPREKVGEQVRVFPSRPTARGTWICGSSRESAGALNYSDIFLSMYKFKYVILGQSLLWLVECTLADFE